MSHVFKNNLKKYYFTFKIILVFVILYFFYNGIINYSGNKVLYAIFSLISNYLIVFGFRKNAFFFDTFFSLLLWLGFWFKFTYVISSTDGYFYGQEIGDFNYSSNSFNDTLIVSSIGLTAFIIAGYIREFILFNYPKKLQFNFKNKTFFKKNRNKIWLAFLILIITIGFSNLYFMIYQKGLLPINNYNFLFSGFYKWLLLFGLASFSSFIIFAEINMIKKLLFSSLIIIFFETFLSSFSMLSRGMIFNALAILYGIYKFSNKINNNFNYLIYLRSILIIFIFFYISVMSVNYIRANYFYIGKSSKIIENTVINNETETIVKNNGNVLEKQNLEILYLLINRWVGIDGVMAVVSKKELLNLDFLKKSLFEIPQPQGITFYENEFNIATLTNEDKIYENVKGITLPGIIAFFYYSGSYILMFIFIFFCCLIASFLEYFAFKLSKQNLIFSSLIGQVIAYRFIHFGYMPQNSYLLFSSIFITILVAFFLKKALFISKT